MFVSTALLDFRPMIAGRLPLPFVLSVPVCRRTRRAFGTILVIWMGALLVAGGAAFGGPFQHDPERSAHHDVNWLSTTEFSQSAIMPKHNQVGRALLAAVSVHPLQAGELGDGSGATASDDRDPDDDCCGVSCHGAVANRIESCGTVRSDAVIPPVNCPAVQGVSQHPLERPPRFG